MNRIDLPHLVWALENLAAGSVVNRITVDPETAHWARVALDRMLALPGVGATPTTGLNPTPDWTPPLEPGRPPHGEPSAEVALDGELVAQQVADLQLEHRCRASARPAGRTGRTCPA